MKTGEHNRWNWIWALLSLVQQSCTCPVHKLSYQSTVLRKCRVCFTHSLLLAQGIRNLKTLEVCVGRSVGGCKLTSSAVSHQHCCWSAAHRVLQRFEHTARILNGCYPDHLIRFDLHAMEFESSLRKGIFMHLQHGLKSNTFVQVWIPTVFLAVIRMKWACFERLLHCHVPQCSLKWLKAQSLKTEE